MTNPEFAIRPERPDDVPAVFAVNAAAFETPAEAKLVDALRQRAEPIVSLVAEWSDGSVVGHVLFSPVELAGFPALKLMGLAPMAVSPEKQRRGVGTALVERGLEACRSLGAAAAVVLGHPDYYPRFGFRPAAEFGIRCEYDVPANAFLAIELQPGGLHAAVGTTTYHPAFGDL